MDKINVGFIGLGQRGNSLLHNVLNHFEDINVVALCDEYLDRVEDKAKIVKEKRNVDVDKYVDYKLLLKNEKVNVVIISASWEAHVPLAIDAMLAGKAVGLEVGGAYSVEDCFRLVRVQEQTGAKFMFLENCCYGKYELLVDNMVKQGVFGEIVYCHGAYCHDLRGEICGGVKNRHYRLRNYLTRNCENYPTHELGPIAKMLNINRGNRMISLSSFSSKSRGLAEFVKGKEEYEFLQDKHFAQGDVVVTNITCADGTLITLKLETTLVRAYSRELSISGTKAVYNEQGNVLLTDKCEFDHEQNMNKQLNSAEKFEEKYMPEIWKKVTSGEVAAGHGGMDFIMLREFFEHLKFDAEMPIDVYDAASWMAISCLSEASIAKGGAVVEIPDFTSGKWVIRQPKNILG